MNTHPFLQVFSESMTPDLPHENTPLLPKPVLATIKLLPLPGSIGFQKMDQIQEVLHRAEQEATALASGGVHGLILENTFDQNPSAAKNEADEHLDPAAIALMSRMIRRIRQLTDLPIGVSVLPNNPETALALSAVNDGLFVRIPLAVGAKVASNGFLHGKLLSVLAYQKQLGLLKQPFYLVDLSIHHILPGDVSGSLPESLNQAGINNLTITLTPPLVHLIKLAKYIESQCPANILSHLIFVVSDTELTLDELARLRELLAIPVMVCNQSKNLPEDQSDNQASELYQVASGLILDSGIRKKATSNRLPTVDMNKVESLMNQLQSVKSIATLQSTNPDFFVG